MKKFATVLIALVLSGHAYGCTDPTEPSFLASLENADSVFVFRVTTLRMIDRRTDGHYNVISGPIQLVKTIKGAPSFKRVAYQDISCGGIQLIVGHYYLASAKQNGSILAFVRGDNSVLDVTEEFEPLARPEIIRRGLTTSITNYLAGKPLDKYTLRSLPFRNLYGAPPPQPPMPRD
ncbi:hypothetical protein [Solilutibacter tolerans]|uniref:Tissue inhibitor of metalloproteinase n=1 Tax=Solilutibacter tolerans TaxID=1604334 RepID=A0A1N6YR66_9GAMM|nr:hypothetical protein [Lysobacter tolerans]SIR17080.1 hypothetical protein SAMN05421546_0032 [Lysobacter tolerans]